MEKLQLDIWSDMLCPFCFIGKRNLDEALARFEHKDDIQIQWHSFQLAPYLQYDATIDAHQALANHKNMDYLQAKQLNEQVAQMAKHAGITFNLDQMKWANSYDAHRVLQFAKSKELTHALEDCLFEAVFVKGENISDKSTLLTLAVEVGLPIEEMEQLLYSDAYGEAVNQDIQLGGQYGLRGVPFFVAFNSISFSGALPPETFLEALRDIHSKWKASTMEKSTLSGESCDIEGNC